METKQNDLMLALQDKEQAIEIFTGEKLDVFLKEIETDALNFVSEIWQTEIESLMEKFPEDIKF